jgi:hypothetical protein
MNSSSAQTDCSITSSDTHTITFANDITIETGFIAQTMNSVLSDTITITTPSSWSEQNYTYATTGASGASVTIGSIDPGVFTWKLPEEWVDSFPDYSKVQEMCDKYPAFKIAFEKFKQMYDLVEDDYEAKKGNKYVP